MPTLILSKPWLSNTVFNNSNTAMCWTWSTSNLVSQAPVIASTGPATGGAILLIIHKGTIETFPSFTDRNTRASDVLITFSLPGTNMVDYYSASSTHYRTQVGRHLTNQAASASGQATWFLLCRAGTTSLTDKGALTGSVGLSGTGADLEIPDINIVSGQNYRSNGFYMNFPLTFTW